MTKRKSSKNPLDVSDLLRREPWLTKNEICDRLSWTPETVNDILKELHVVKKRDATKGRAFRFAIQLSRGKIRALEMIRRQEGSENAGDSGRNAANR